MYSFHIIRNLLRLISADKHSSVHEVVLYTPREIQKRFLGGEYPFCRNRIITLPRLWTQVRLSWEMAGNDPDVLFVPSHTLPLVHPRKSVVMIHDTAFRRFKKAYSFFQYSYLQFSTWLAVREASKILVPSKATRDDLIQFFGCKKEKIVVIPHGFSPPDPVQMSEKNQREFLQRYGILFDENGAQQNKYFFYVGRLEEKKNLVRLVRAFALFREKHPEFKLILAGGRGVGFRKLFNEVEYLDLWGSVIMPGYVTEEEKAILYQHCEGFVFPSLYEGFGMPILEAFYHGKPVLASNAGALPEVCGDAAIIVDPENETAIFEGLGKLLRPGKLVEKGQERLKHFDWKVAAGKTLEVFINI